MAIEHCSGNRADSGSAEEHTIKARQQHKPPREDSGRSQAAQRLTAQRSRWRQMARTILLGTTTALAGVVWVAQQYGVAVADSLAFLGSSVVFVLALIGVALVAACVLWLLRKLLQR